MKIKENKGFAVTALLYGLSIMSLMTVALMMSIMQNTRKNTTTTVKSIEEELNNYGSTAIDYTNEGAYVVPEGQTGYYHIELCGSNNTLTTGSIYLPENTVLAYEPGTTSSQIKIGGSAIMIASSNESETFVNGMAKYYNKIAAYPFINGQVITNSGCTNGMTMNKVSTTAPVSPNSSIFDSGGTITTKKNANITVVYYNENSKDAPGTTTGSNVKTLSVDAGKKISEIYIDYKEQVDKNTEVKINDSQISKDSPYDFKQEGYTISRFSLINDTIPIANYVITKVKIDSNKYSIEKGTVLTAQSYSPPIGANACTEAFNVANNPNNNSLIHYGSDMLARPVKTENYKSKNTQKWRIESTEDNMYKIIETEEYKVLQVNKHDTSVSTLVCGVFTCENEFKSDDKFTNNPNQKWKLDQTGLGTYRFKVNNDLGGGQYLQFKNDATGERFITTTDANQATLFYLYNGNL